MGIGESLYIVFAVVTFHAVVAGIYWTSAKRGVSGQSESQARLLVRRTLAVSVGLTATYLTAALTAFQLLPVNIGYAVFVVAWAIYGTLLGCLFADNLRRTNKLRAMAIERRA